MKNYKEVAKILIENNIKFCLVENTGEISNYKLDRSLLYLSIASSDLVTASSGSTVDDFRDVYVKSWNLKDIIDNPLFKKEKKKEEIDYGY